MTTAHGNGGKRRHGRAALLQAVLCGLLLFAGRAAAAPFDGVWTGTAVPDNPQQCDTVQLVADVQYGYLIGTAWVPPADGLGARLYATRSRRHDHRRDPQRLVLRHRGRLCRQLQRHERLGHLQR